MYSFVHTIHPAVGNVGSDARMGEHILLGQPLSKVHVGQGLAAAAVGSARIPLPDELVVWHACKGREKLPSQASVALRGSNGRSEAHVNETLRSWFVYEFFDVRHN